MKEGPLKYVNFIKPLPQELIKNGFTYIQVRRGLKSLVFEQRFKNQLIAYEVFIIKIRPERYFKRIYREARERFPENEAFGRWAWSYSTFDDAVKRFNSLEEF